MVNIFAYGELTKKEVLKKLINRIPKMIKGRVYGYKRIFCEDIGYYGAIKDKNSFIEGVILLDINNNELKIIDDFEDLNIFYIRERTTAIGEDNKKYPVYIYIRCNYESR
ncbi:gamma-glutamylcyclotransferase family protein [Methanocaldococcus indicus]|uniref:gamma-glutamylcyclotransferase family protein n=1 Tax=Methanocaldococcus indicus TaxID=213231 RepID=UPI003C6DAF69